MSEAIWYFLQTVADRPQLILAAGLAAAVILVNGATDASNAIAAAVGSGAISFPRATALAAVGNLVGAIGAFVLSGAVARTIGGIADFGARPQQALTALCSALAAIVIWALAAWRFGIPTSESHALVAALAGAALAMPGGWANLRPGPWTQVALGLVLSVGLGLWLGRASARVLRRSPNLGDSFYRRAQVAGACLTALLHGAQDGQKFLGVLLLGASLVMGDNSLPAAPLWLAGLCALTMALGTALGGRRIVERVGRDLVPLTLREGFAADLGSGAALILCTVLGLPVSTTHTKTAAILGAGCEEGSHPNLACARSIGLAWLLTFPGCGALGYLLASGLGELVL